MAGTAPRRVNMCAVGGSCLIGFFCGLIRNPPANLLEQQPSLNGWPIAFMGCGALLSASGPVHLYITSDLFPLMGPAITLACPAVTGSFPSAAGHGQLYPWSLTCRLCRYESNGLVPFPLRCPIGSFESLLICLNEAGVEMENITRR